jgi:8-oxo-dGTP pyrophosphatase MutT (NUDIX family)
VTDRQQNFTETLPRKRMAAAVLFTDGADRVLLVEPTYKEHWELPGGCVEANESPYAAAVREVDEELGLAVTPGRLIVVDWVPPRPDHTEGVMVVFDGGSLLAERAAEIRLPSGELSGWAWCTPSDCAERLSPLLARRVRWALDAAACGVTHYLEDGHGRQHGI